jgi:hypothetical protein
LKLSRDDDRFDRLARLFGIGAGNFLGWEDSELHDILLRELNAPLIKWLKPKSIEFQMLTESAATKVGSINCIGDLLSSPNPPLPYLRRAKDIAKSADLRLKTPLPPPIASALYLAVIAVAMIKCGQRITKMNDHQLCEGLNWVANQSWVESHLRRTAIGALQLIEGNK